MHSPSHVCLQLIQNHRTMREALWTSTPQEVGTTLDSSQKKKIVSWRICIVKSSSSAWTQSPSRSTLPLSHPYPYFFPSPWHLTDLAVVETYLPPRPAQVEGRGKEALFLTLCTLLVHEISLLSPLIHLANPFSCLKRIVTAQADVRCSNRRKSWFTYVRIRQIEPLNKKVKNKIINQI